MSHYDRPGRCGRRIMFGRSGRVAGLGVPAAAFLGLMLAPLAQADSPEQDLSGLLPAVPHSAASSAEAEGNASADFADLSAANGYIHDFEGDFLQAAVSPAEFGPMINDTLSVVADTEGVINEFESAASIGLDIANLVPGA